MTDFKDGDQVVFTGLDGVGYVGTIHNNGAWIQVEGSMGGLTKDASDVRLLEPQSEAILNRLLSMAETECAQWKENYDEARAHIDRLEAAQVPRDTLKGDWPEDGQMIQRWNGILWRYENWIGGDCIWLPAPPAPRGDTP